ncbi:MAG: hypothetical protein QOJ57_545 [Thermoleophilaceae bacterium]|nr:hypothetical protein [Thermoleophilaceae bacterium]
MSPKSLFLALLLSAIVPAVANADGLPLPVDDAGPGGIVARDGSGRYVTIPVRGGTLVERVETSGGRIADSKFLPGSFTIPVVALDGTPDGLSSNGHTLVLIRPRAGFPRSKTALVVLDTRRLTTRRMITLRGDFSFDAVSRDGSTIFVINYIDPTDPTRYRVRALDPATGRLAPHAIVDPKEPGDAMRGYPLDRATSPDGAWHYTLYDASPRHPFVHALNTEERRAKCIDLPPFPNGVDSSALRLGLLGGGRTLTVGSLATVDTRSFEVTPGSKARPAARQAKRGSGASVVPWIAGFGVLLLAGGVVLSRRSRRRSRGRTAAAA